jgi:hypothetical protein
MLQGILQPEDYYHEQIKMTLANNAMQLGLGVPGRSEPFRSFPGDYLPDSYQRFGEAARTFDARVPEYGPLRSCPSPIFHGIDARTSKSRQLGRFQQRRRTSQPRSLHRTFVQHFTPNGDKPVTLQLHGGDRPA